MVNFSDREQPGKKYVFVNPLKVKRNDTATWYTPSLKQETK